MARCAGLNIAEQPGRSIFNPIFIWGASAVGKTHLANAIGLAVKERYPEKRVLYVSANLFQMQYSDAVVRNQSNDFLNFYQSIDVLIIDDVMTTGSTVESIAEKLKGAGYEPAEGSFGPIVRYNKQRRGERNECII